MPSVCFSTISLRRSWDSSLLLPIMKCFLSDTLVMRNLFIGHQLGLIQLILICTNRGQDCFLNTDRFQLVYWLPMPFYTPFSSCVQYLFPLSFHFITHNFCHGHTCFDFCIYVWITWVVTDIWWKFHSNSPIGNIFTGKNDAFNTYFPRCIK